MSSRSLFQKLLASLHSRGAGTAHTLLEPCACSSVFDNPQDLSSSFAMSEHNDGQYTRDNAGSFYPESTLSRQNNVYPGGRRQPRYSRVSSTSWVDNGMLSPSPFARPPSSLGSRPLPHPVASPVPSNVMSEFHPSHPTPSELGPEPEQESYSAPPQSDPRDDRDWEPEPETENMTIGQSVEDYTGRYDEYLYPEHQEEERHVLGEDDTYTYPVGQQEPELLQEKKPKRKNFVGGFVSGLRKLPKAVVKSHFYDRKSTRKGAPGTELDTGLSHFLPAYDEPGTAVLHPENVQYVQGVEMPQPTAGPSGAPNQPTEVAYTEATRQSSQQRVSHPRSSLLSSSHGHTASPVASSPRFRSPVAEAVVVDPLPASDYKKMHSPIRFPGPDDSISTHLTRVHKFFTELKNLPWTSDRVAEDYIPDASARAHVGRAKPKGSWYTVSKHQDIDLLAPAPSSARAATLPLRSEDGATNSSVRSASRMQQVEGRTPLSYMTSPGVFPSPGASSHGQGQHNMSYSYYFAPPQPLYVYQSPMASPVGHISDSSASTMSPQEAHRAVPVYMMAGPPPGLIPAPPPTAHAAQHNQPARAASPPPHLPSTRPLSGNTRKSRHSGSNSH